MSIFIEYIVRLLNFIAPKQCVVCGKRLTISEDVICAVCNLHMPRTLFSKNPYENKMAKLFWGQIKIEKAAALFFYEPHSEMSRIILSLKYFNHPETGELMGRMLAEEIRQDGFFDDIDLIIPIPLTKKRQRERGYNQSMEIARGINEITKIKIVGNAVKRKSFKQSQTKMNRWQRLDNVKDVFTIDKEHDLDGKHILLIDDVVTSGSTIISCAQKISAHYNNIKFSVLSLGFTKN